MNYHEYEQFITYYCMNKQILNNHFMTDTISNMLFRSMVFNATFNNIKEFGEVNRFDI
jgi:hypothetical protein